MQYVYAALPRSTTKQNKGMVALADALLYAFLAALSKSALEKL